MAGFKQLFKSAIGDNDPTAMEDLGTIRHDLNRVYKYVKFAGANAVAKGDAVAYVVSDTNFQTVDGATAGVVAAGISMCAASGTVVSYGWVQIDGIAFTSWTVPGSVGNALTIVGATYPALIVRGATADSFSATVGKTGASGTGVILCRFPH